MEKDQRSPKSNKSVTFFFLAIATLCFPALLFLIPESEVLARTFVSFLIMPLPFLFIVFFGLGIYFAIKTKKRAVEPVVVSQPISAPTAIGEPITSTITAPSVIPPSNEKSFTFSIIAMALNVPSAIFIAPLLLGIDNIGAGSGIIFILFIPVGIVSLVLTILAASRARKGVSTYPAAVVMVIVSFLSNLPMMFMLIGVPLSLIR